MSWFGESWGAPCCEEEHVPTPVGEACVLCDEPIEAGDRGFISPFREDGGMVLMFGADGVARLAADQDAYVDPRHAECQLRMVLGSVGHIEGRCTCVLGDAGEEDPPGLTAREAAIAAVAAYERKYGRRLL